MCLPFHFVFCSVFFVFISMWLDFCHYDYDYYYYCRCPLCKECVLYIVIKKSCWTVTYSFESGLNFIFVGNSEMGTGAFCSWNLTVSFFFFLPRFYQRMKINLKNLKKTLFVIVLDYKSRRFSSKPASSGTNDTSDNDNNEKNLAFFLRLCLPAIFYQLLLLNKEIAKGSLCFDFH